MFDLTSLQRPGIFIRKGGIAGLFEGDPIFWISLPLFFEFQGAKGQTISEQNCGVLNFPKMQQNYC